MARAGLALAVVAVLPLLAGCVSPGNAVPDAEPLAEAGLAVAPSHLVAGTFYAFRHAGGTLGLGVLPGGRAQVELFDGGDQRIGQLSLSDAFAGGALEMQNMAAGDYVIRMLAVNGTLRIASGGAAPALRPLAAHVERVVLAQVDEPSTLPANIPLPGESRGTERDLDLPLLRAPTSLRILVAGNYATLDVELRGALGPILESHTGGSPFSFPEGASFSSVDAAFHPENVRDGHLAGHLAAQDLHGTVLLEAASYSRAEPVAAPTVPAAPARFSYGTLPDVPVRFQTGPRASTLLFHGATVDGERSWVALFDDHGRRLGTLALDPGATLAVPVAASSGYVAVTLRGNATLGADAAPGDFELHPLRVHQQAYPTQGAGDGSSYRQGSEVVNATFVYAIQPVDILPTQNDFGLPGASALRSCGDATLRLAQGGETLDGWPFDFRGPPAASAATLRLHDGPLQVWDDGFGTPGCARPGALLRSFEL